MGNCLPHFQLKVLLPSPLQFPFLGISVHTLPLLFFKMYFKITPIYTWDFLFLIGSLSSCTYRFLFVVCDTCVSPISSPLICYPKLLYNSWSHLSTACKNKVVLSKLGTLITKWESKSCICTVYVTAPIDLYWCAKIQQIPRVT